MGQTTTPIPGPGSPIEHSRVAEYADLPEPDGPRIAYITSERQYAIVEFPVGVREYVDMETYTTISEAPRVTATVEVSEDVNGTESYGPYTSEFTSNITVDKNTIITGIPHNGSGSGSISISDEDGSLVSTGWAGSGTASFPLSSYPRAPGQDLTITVSINTDDEFDYRINNPQGGELYSHESGPLPCNFEGDSIQLRKYDFL
jgi:hypothetical protein